MPNLWNPDLYQAAWVFATRKHAGQTYGGQIEGEQIPYISHIASVAMEVSCGIVQTAENLNANLAVQCALLHDTLEDTDTSFEEIATLFGADVAQGVAALSKNTSLPSKQVQMEDSITRILLQPKEVWMVKLADRIANLYHPPFYWGRDKILAYQEEARYILRELGGSNAPLAHRLELKIKEYSRFVQ